MREYNEQSMRIFINTSTGKYRWKIKMNLNKLWVIATIVLIIALDILYNMGLSYVSSALPVFLFQLYTLNKEGKIKEDENEEERKKRTCKECTKSVKSCFCA